METIGIYEIYNKETGRRYIGSSIEIERRFHVHKLMLNSNKHDNKYLQNAWNKHGESSFEFKIIETCSKEDRLNREQYYLDTIPKLYNLNPFAKETPKLTLEQIEYRTQKIKEHWEKHGTDKLKGKIPWNKGKTMSKEHCEKLKNSAKGRTQTKEGSEKRLKALSKKSKKVLQYDKNMNFIKKWNSAREISESLLGYSISGIHSCCNGSTKRNYYKDYIFKYEKHKAPLDSNVQKESDEFGESLSLIDKVTPSQVSNTLEKGVTTTGAVESA